MSDNDGMAWTPAPETFPGEYALLLKGQRLCLVALRAENAKLKAALERIAAKGCDLAPDYPTCLEPLPVGCTMVPPDDWCLSCIATRALAPKEGKP